MVSKWESFDFEKYKGHCVCCLDNLQFIDKVMDRYVYLNILKLNLKLSVKEFGTSDCYYFQRNNLTYKSHLIREWLLCNTSHALEIPPQSPDINIMEYIWGELKFRARKYIISNVNYLKNVLREE